MDSPKCKRVVMIKQISSVQERSFTHSLTNHLKRLPSSWRWN